MNFGLQFPMWKSLCACRVRSSWPRRFKRSSLWERTSWVWPSEATAVTFSRPERCREWRPSSWTRRRGPSGCTERCVSFLRTLSSHYTAAFWWIRCILKCYITDCWGGTESKELSRVSGRFSADSSQSCWYAFYLIFCFVLEQIVQSLEWI